MPPNPSESGHVATLITRLNELQAESPNLLTNEDLRKQALETARQLTQALQTPRQVSMQVCESPVFSMAARVAIDLGIFGILVNSTGPITATDLARTTGAEELLIIRLLRALCAVGLVKEAGVRLYAANAVTNVLASPTDAAAHKHFFDQSMPALARMPEYFATPASKYCCPTDPHAGPFQFANKTELQTFDYWMRQCPPSVMENFNIFMSGSRNAGSWLNWFPVRERLLHGYRTVPSVAEYPDEDVLLVDVGGGIGHDLQDFAHHIGKGLRCRLVLQDLSGVLADAGDLDPRIKPVAHSFFSPQIVKGARAYFFHKIMHDWSDDVCLSILEKVHDALRPGYSRLLINDNVIPETGASPSSVALDMQMMALHVGMERTKEQWLSLLGRAGLRVIKVWERGGQEGIVEAEKEGA